MARYSLISYHDPKVGAWTIPEPILGCDEESIKNFVQQIERTIKAGKVKAENDGFECFRVGVFDDDEGKIYPCAPEHLVDLHAPQETVAA